MKHIELEQFLHAFMSPGFVSVSWAFLYVKLYCWCQLKCIYRKEAVVCNCCWVLLGVVLARCWHLSLMKLANK